MASTSKDQDRLTVLTPTPSTQIQIPELDLLALAKITRKSLDRLASFSNMKSASDPSPVLTKISTKIHALIRLIDTSMLSAQLGYQLATDATLLCESAIIVVDADLAEWDAGVSVDLDTLRETCRDGWEKAGKVLEGFRDVKQEVYKIAASTKDNMFIVLVPPDVNHSETMKIHLKDIGTGLVANLKLLSEFSSAVLKVSDWWSSVKEDLESLNPTSIPSLLPPVSNIQDEVRRMLTRWSAVKEGFQQYYDIISVAQGRYPDLLPSSSAAWTAVTAARSAVPSSLGHDEKGATALPDRVGMGRVAKGMHYMLAGIVGLKMMHPASSRERKEKGKGSEKENENENENSAEHHVGLKRRSVATYRSGTRSGSSRRSSLSVRGPVNRVGERDRKHERDGSPANVKNYSSFSCCSIALFGDDDVSRLGCHAGGFMMSR